MVLPIGEKSGTGGPVNDRLAGLQDCKGPAASSPAPARFCIRTALDTAKLFAGQARTYR